MEKTKIVELSKKVMDSYVKALPLDQWFWPTIFPVKPSPTLRYTTLLGEKGAPIMADFVSFGATIPEKRREAVDKLFGEITKTAISRKMDEDEYNDYLQLRNLAGTDLDDILNYVYDDIDFCYRGVMARLEWLTLQAVSRGIVAVTTTNNEGPPTTSNINFQIPTENKLKAQTAVWSGNTATATPIKDLINMNRIAKSHGVTLIRFLMRQSDFYDLIAADEIKNTITPILFSGTQTTNVNLGLQQVNAYLSSIDLPPIKIIDQTVQAEIKGARTSLNPWEQYQVAGIPATQLGNMLSAPIAEEGMVKQVTESKRSNILVQKYAKVDPFAEFTKGITNSFPKFQRANEVYLMDVSSI